MSLTCLQCGNGFEREGKRGPIPKFCRACRPKSLPQPLERQCPVCDVAFVRPVHRGGRNAIYCSDRCRRRYARPPEVVARQLAAARERYRIAMLERGPLTSTCSECGEVLVVQSAGAKTCGPECARLRRRRGPGPCTVEGCTQPITAKGLCRTHYNQQLPDRHRSKGDPEVRRRNYRRRTQRRRALTRDPDAELIDRDLVGDRDGWCCGICAETVDQALAYPDPQSPSLDHVEPLSLGGRHTYANVRIAHLSCNVKRGNRVEAAA